MIEALAALLGVIYLVLAIRQHAACWAAAFASSCLYVGVLFRAHLYMESALNGFFAVMAVYGYWHWKHGHDGHGVTVGRWSGWRHVSGAALVVALAAVSGYLLRRFTAAASPFTDSAVTWASVFATFLVARKVYENWYWWLIIDTTSLCLYFSRGLYLTMALYAAYVVMIFIGMREWRRTLAAVTVNA